MPVSEDACLRKFKKIRQLKKEGGFLRPRAPREGKGCLRIPSTAPFAMRRELQTNALGDVVPMRRLKFKRTRASKGSAGSHAAMRSHDFDDKENMSLSSASGKSSAKTTRRAPLAVLSRNNSSNSNATSNGSFKTCNSEVSVESKQQQQKRAVVDPPSSRQTSEDFLSLSEGEHSFDAFDVSKLEESLLGTDVQEFFPLSSPYDQKGAQMLIGELEEECNFLRSSIEVSEGERAPREDDALRAEVEDLTKKLSSSEAALQKSETVRRAQEDAIRTMESHLKDLEESSRLALSRQDAAVGALREELAEVKSSATRDLEDLKRERSDLRGAVDQIHERQAQAASEKTVSTSSGTAREIVLDTSSWLDFSCQVNTIDNNVNPVFNPLAAAAIGRERYRHRRCSSFDDNASPVSSPSRSESSSSDGETDPLVHATAGILRLRRQNERLKGTIEVVTKRASKTKEELLKKNGVLVSTIERQAAENFELVCKHRQSMTKLSVVMEDLERLRVAPRADAHREEALALRAERAALRRELEIRESDLKSLRAELATFVDKLQDQQSKLTQAAALERARLEAELNRKLEGSLRDREAEYNAKVAECHASSSRLAEETLRAALKKQEVELRQKFREEIESAGACLTKQVEMLQEEKKEAIGALQESLQALEMLEEAHERQKISAAEEIARLTKDKEASEKDLLSIVEEVNQDRMALNARVAEAQAEITSLTESHAKAIALMREDHTDAMAKMKESLNRAATDEHDRILELERSRDEAEEARAKAMADLRQARDQAEALGTTNGDMEAALSAIEHQSEALEMTLAALKEDHADQMACAREEHAGELRRVREDLAVKAEEDKAQAVEAERSLAEARASEAAAGLEARALQEREEALSRCRRELEPKMAAALERQRGQQEATAAERETIAALRTELASNKAALSELQKTLKQQSKETLEMALLSAKRHPQDSEISNATLSALKDEHTSEITRLRNRHSTEVFGLKEEVAAVTKANLLMDSQVAKAEVSIKRLQKAVSRLSTENAELCSKIVEREQPREEADAPVRTQALALPPSAPLEADRVKGEGVAEARSGDEERERERVSLKDSLILDELILQLKDSVSMKRAKKAQAKKKQAKKPAKPSHGGTGARGGSRPATARSAPSAKKSSWK